MNGTRTPTRRRHCLIASALPAAVALVGGAAMTMAVMHVDPGIAATADMPVAAAAEPEVAVEPNPQLYAEAVQTFRDRRYAAAYGRFARLADAGHAPSAHIALVMVRHGLWMFGSDWSATPAQQERWNALVVGDGGRGPLPRFDDDENGD